MSGEDCGTFSTLSVKIEFGLAEDTTVFLTSLLTSSLHNANNEFPGELASQSEQRRNDAGSAWSIKACPAAEFL